MSPRAPARPAADEFRELLAPGAIRAVFQPIVRLADLHPIGYEGLARFPTPPGLVALPPDVTLAAAGRLGVREDLEVACWAAISEAGTPPAGRLLFVNVAPDALGHPGLLELAGELPERLVIELTEQDAVQNTAQLRERLRPWSARGALVAVDDAGAGFTSLEYVADLRPDFLKLCRGMVTGVDLDPSRQAVLRATVAFAREVGARVVAEGVERPEELEVLRDAEVDYGQGWLFGRPAEAWPEGATARPAAPARPLSGRLESELAAATSAPEASEVVVEHLAAQGPDAERLPRGRRPPALPGGARLLADLRRDARDGRRDRPHLPQGRGDDRRGRRLEPRLPARRRLCQRRGVRAAPHPRGGRRRAQRGVPDRARRRRDRRGPALRRTAVGAAGGDRWPGRRLARAAARADRRAAGLARDRRGHRPRDRRRRPRAGRLRVRDARAARRPRRLLRPPRRGLVRRRARRARGSGARADRRLGRQGHLQLHGRRHRRPRLRGPRGPTSRGRQRRDRAAARRRGGAARAAGRHRPRQPPHQHRAGRAAGAARRPGGRLAADGRRGHRAARARGARPADRARPPRHLYAEVPEARTDTPASRRVVVLLADVDGFKAINDSRGHAAGDDVLRAVAGVLRAVAPAHGRAYRIGGDEFAMLFDCSGEAEAWRVGWDLQAQSRSRLGTTMSIGLAIAGAAESDEQLVARADAALYEVKRRGRDGVLLAPAGLDQPTTSA